jgi:histone H3/H4
LKGLVITLILLASPFLVEIHLAHATGALGSIEPLNKIALPIVEAVTEPLMPIAEAAGELTDNVVQPLAEAVTEPLKPIAKAARELTDNVVQPLAEAVTEPLMPIAEAAGELTENVVQLVAEAVTEALMPIAEAAGELTDNVVKSLTEAVTEPLMPIAEAAGELTDNVVKPLAEAVTEPLMPIVEAAGELTENVVQPVAEVVTEPLKPIAKAAEELTDNVVQPVLDLVISPAESVSADKSPTPKAGPSGIAPSTAPSLPVTSRLETAGGSYTAEIQSIPKPTPPLSKEKGRQSAIANSSNKFMSAKTSQFPERETIPTIPSSEPTLPPSASAVGSLLPLAASVKDGKAKPSYSGSNCKAVLIDKADAMIQCSRMSWHCRTRHYLNWSHAPPLRPPVAPALDNCFSQSRTKECILDALHKSQDQANVKRQTDYYERFGAMVKEDGESVSVQNVPRAGEKTDIQKCDRRLRRSGANHDGTRFGTGGGQLSEPSA